jgi:hypothetical protein
MVDLGLCWFCVSIGTAFGLGVLVGAYSARRMSRDKDGAMGAP